MFNKNYLIWAATIIGSLWAVNEIVSHFVTSVSEKGRLLADTAEMAEELGLTPEQAAALLTNVSAQTKTGSDGIMDTLKWVALLYFGSQMLKSS